MASQSCLIRHVPDATLIAHSPPTHLSRMLSPWRCHEPHETSLFDTAHLLSKAAGCNELEGLHLAEMRGITKHMDVHELGHIPVTVQGVLLAEGSAQCSALLGNDIALLRRSLALPDGPDELPAGSSGN